MNLYICVMYILAI